MSKGRRCRRAAISFYPLAALYLMHTWVGLLHSTEMVRPYITAIASIIITGIICGLLVYVARGVRYGKRLGGAIALLSFLAFQALVVAVAICLTGAANAVPVLRWIQCLYVINLMIAFALTLVASTGGDHDTMAGVEVNKRLWAARTGSVMHPAVTDAVPKYRGTRRSSMFPLYRLWSPDPPEGVPKAYWKRSARTRTAIASVMAAMWTLWVIMAAGTVLSPTWVVYAPPGVGLIVVSAAILLPVMCRRAYRRSKRRFCATVSRDGFQVCVECGYLLRGLPNAHTCPECGCQYDKDTLTATWTNWRDDYSR